MTCFIVYSSLTIISALLKAGAGPPDGKPMAYGGTQALVPGAISALAGTSEACLTGSELFEGTVPTAQLSMTRLGRPAVESCPSGMIEHGVFSKTDVCDYW